MGVISDSFAVYRDPDNPGKMYISKPYTTATDTISVVTGIAKDYIKGLFPKNYFAYDYIETSDTVVQQVRNDGNQVAQGVHITKFPSLAIAPRLTLDVPVEGMESNMMLNATNMHLLKDVDKNYANLFRDFENGANLYYTIDYSSMIYEIRIRTEKFEDTINLGHYLKSNIRFDFSQYLNSVPVEIELPRTFVRIIGETAGINMDVERGTDEYEQSQALLDALLAKYTAGNCKIVRKFDSKTAHDVYYARLPQNILVKITPDDMPSSPQRFSGMAEGDYTTMLTLQMAFYMPSAFLLELKKPFDLSQIDDEEVLDRILSSNYPLQIPDENIAYLFTGDDHKKIELKPIHKESFVMPNNEDVNTIAIGSGIPKELRAVIQYCTDRKISMDNILYYALRTSTTRVPADKYKLDYSTMSIELVRPLRNTTYYLAMYIYEPNYLQILKAIKAGDQRFGTDVLATLKITVDGAPVEIPVYKFKTKKELRAITPKYIVRASTRFGPGYIPMVDEYLVQDGDVVPNPDASPIKLCLGYDKFNNPIVKCMQRKLK